jgi:hypothetical protein
MKNISTDASNAQSCIDTCSHCHRVCLQTAMGHCLTTGGKHTAPEHFRLMMDCAAICQLSANFQLSRSSFDTRLCGLCAEVCEACARSCEAIGDMDDCVKACKNCANSCRSMSANVPQ